MLAPKICALGVEEGVVRHDGAMTRQNAENVAVAAIERMGQARVQTLIFNELAVTPYHLAKPGHVTRWDRCVAMGYSGYDGQSAKMKSDFPPRARFFRSVARARTGSREGWSPRAAHQVATIRPCFCAKRSEERPGSSREPRADRKGDSPRASACLVRRFVRSADIVSASPVSR